MASTKIHIRVVPRADRNEVVERNGELVVRVTAAPIDGAANAAVLEILADHLDVHVRHLTVTHGEKSRRVKENPPSYVLI